MSVPPVIVNTTTSSAYLPQAKSNRIPFRGDSSQYDNSRSSNGAETLWAVSSVVGTIGILTLVGLMLNKVSNMEKANKEAEGLTKGIGESAKEANESVKNAFKSMGDYFQEGLNWFKTAEKPVEKTAVETQAVEKPIAETTVNKKKSVVKKAEANKTKVKTDKKLTETKAKSRIAK